MTVTITKILKNNKNQVVLLPKIVEFSSTVKEVSIVAMGNKRIITPTNETWDGWFDNPQVTDDFMFKREQPEDQLREIL